MKKLQTGCQWFCNLCIVLFEVITVKCEETQPNWLHVDNHGPLDNTYRSLSTATIINLRNKNHT